jgi:single stranded DNA-binding protein
MLNITFLVGRVGKNPPSFRTIATGCLCTFSFATNERYWNKRVGEPKSMTEWHKILCYASSEQAGKMKYLRSLLPGDLLAIVGKSCTRQWTRRDGIKAYDHYVDVSPSFCRIQTISHARHHREKDGEHIEGDPQDALGLLATNADPNEPEFPFGDEAEDSGEVVF